MNYELKLDKFQGPLDKLLELIEENKFDVSAVSLARVTDDFLKYLRALSEKNEPDIRLIADFVSVASRLVLIKSKHILPGLALTGEEEAEIEDLERRLALYAELRPMMKNAARLWSGKKASFGRPYFLELGLASRTASVSPRVSGRAAVFYPGRNLELQAMIAELAKLFLSIKRLELETRTVKEKIITIEEKIKEIMERLRAEKETKFAHLAGAKTKREIIAIFLAILHLAREQIVFLEQAERFSDIIIKRQETGNKKQER